MKNGLLIWNVILTLVAGFLLVKQFSPGASRKNTEKTTSGNTVSNGNFRMAYFEMDSVAAKFEMVKVVKAELSKKEEEINKEIDQLTRNFQKTYMYYQNLAKDGKLSQSQSDSASETIKRMDEDIKLRKQQLDQEYNDLMVRRQNDIKTTIENYMKDYNKEKNYSYIVSFEPGLFYFKDTAYNITADVIRGLNELYKAPVKR